VLLLFKIFSSLRITGAGKLQVLEKNSFWKKQLQENDSC
jgi:hypothetical protein